MRVEPEMDVFRELYGDYVSFNMADIDNCITSNGYDELSEQEMHQVNLKLLQEILDRGVSSAQIRYFNLAAIRHLDELEGKIMKPCTTFHFSHADFGIVVKGQLCTQHADRLKELFNDYYIHRKRYPLPDFSIAFSNVNYDRTMHDFWFNNDYNLQEALDLCLPDTILYWFSGKYPSSTWNCMYYDHNTSSMRLEQNTVHPEHFYFIQQVELWLPKYIEQHISSWDEFANDSYIQPLLNYYDGDFETQVTQFKKDYYFINDTLAFLGDITLNSEQERGMA